MLYKYACKLLLNILFSRPFFVFWSSLTFRGTLSSWISATGKKSRLSGWIKRFYTPQASLCLSVHVNSDVHVTLGLQFDVCGWGVLERGGGGGGLERGGGIKSSNWLGLSKIIFPFTLMHLEICKKY